MARTAVVIFVCVSLILTASFCFAGDFDHTHTRFTLVLQKVVEDGRVDYVQLVREPSELEAYVKELGKVRKKDFEKFDRNRKIAYWINLYNAATMLAVTRNYPIVPKDPNPLYPKSSIRQIPGIWNKMRFNTALGAQTLNQIEMSQIEAFRDPRLYFLVVNGAVGGPDLTDQALHHERIEEQISEAVKNFLLDAGNVRAEPNKNILYLNEMLKWKAPDFVSRYYKLGHFKHRTKEEIAVLNFLHDNVGMMEKMMIIKDKFTIKYTDFDWSLNER